MVQQQAGKNCITKAGKLQAKYIIQLINRTKSKTKKVEKINCDLKAEG